ncbi:MULTISPECIES: alpha/beta hydrolase [unclassified Gordonia (in: high G+C Gram-positive bacteria)]|uniref:alpha/beta hydrolase n=1 Tax=unclassified Gordonia (in: high G+C Gram-positive bacteria) TaxID=2657482 RepID=UPI001F0D4723|nr:alpha/beta hydrolase [Gordonia sp. ABSL49_1]MCH5642402.1 alpha/beta hydrolase [Gordonia sp. ABSL49_1]
MVDVVTASPGTDWQPDRFLDHYQLRTIPLGPDPDGEDPITATLVRKPSNEPPEERPRGAVLYIHGFTDYFFHEPLADHFHHRGYAFYAIDLRKCGRSLGEQHTPHFTTDLDAYDEELDKALDIITAEVGADTPILVAAHSTGGLIASLWLDRLRGSDPARHARVDGLLLNSPWFDLQGDALLRTLPITILIKAVAAVAPKRVIPRELSGVYGESIHESVNGEWAYDLKVKPLGGFPVTFGWLDAVRTGQRRLHRGIDVGVPSLVLRSDKTYFSRRYSESVDVADVVVDVGHIARWSGCLGDRVSVVPIPGARHDVFLSRAQVRECAYREVDGWLGHVVEPTRGVNA